MDVVALGSPIAVVGAPLLIALGLLVAVLVAVPVFRVPLVAVWRLRGIIRIGRPMMPRRAHA